MQPIPQDLIIRAFTLTGKTMEDMYAGHIWQYEVEWNFSYPKFFYYLLSPEFIEKYDDMDGMQWWELFIVKIFWQAIYEYQKWDTEPIVELLTKI